MTARPRLQTIGRFQVIRELGRGAQGAVYLAQDPKLDRPVAIKTLRLAPGARRSADMRALMDEARIVSRLQHPHVVTLFDAGEHDGEPYLVFEYVEGETLAALAAREGKMQVARAIGLVSGVLAGVECAHGKGVIHRDLKPANIIVDGAGVPRVMDFGVARGATSADPGDASTGTPCYMAPELFDGTACGERSDLFSVGLMLYELLTGAPAVEGETLNQVVYQLTNRDFPPPSSVRPDVPGGLDAVVLKALARRPEARYASAAEMRRELDASIVTGERAAGTSGDPKKAALEFLLRRIGASGDFPALSETISTINRVTYSEEQGVSQLSGAILKDFSLTNKLLRLVNTAYFGHFGGTVTTVSRAVMVLGFEAVRSIAVTLVLFEHMQNRAKAAVLYDEVVTAYFTSLVARQMARDAGLNDPEEAAVCALFHDIGRLLVMHYFHEEQLSIDGLVARQKLDAETASARVLGVSYEEIGTAVARAWNFPDRVVQSLRHVKDDRPRKPASDGDRLRLVCSLSHDVARAAGAALPEDRERMLAQLASRFAGAMSVTEERLGAVVQAAVEELGRDSLVLHTRSRASPAYRRLVETAQHGRSRSAEGEAVALPPDDTGCIVLEAPPDHAAADGAAETTGPEAQVILAAGVQDVTNALVGEGNLNDIMRMILEVMYRGLAFTRVLFCLRDGRGETVSARFGFGPDTERVIRSFRFPTGFTPDVFHLSLSKGVDVLIRDVDQENIRSRVPDWYRKLVPAHAFVLLPVAVEKRTVGLLYGDRDGAEPLEIPARELALLKTLRNQAVLALKQKR